MRALDLRNSQGKIWLNVASSHYPLSEFVNLDNHVMMLALDYPLLGRLVPRRNRDLLEAYRAARTKACFIRHDCRKPLPVADGAVDHILCSHFLEHIYPDEAIRTLQDFVRALRPDGTLHLVVPDLAQLARAYLEAVDRGDPSAADDFVRESLLSLTTRGSLRLRVLEMVGSFGLQHRWMYDAASLRTRMIDLGLQLIPVPGLPSEDVRRGDGSVHVAARKPGSDRRPPRTEMIIPAA